MNSPSEPVVSVCMITYNHEQFIRQAIEGVLMQQCDFRFELVIGEDFSTDSTRILCEEYAKKYPEIVRLLPSQKNLGMIPNFVRTLQACTRKYIAFCEGDDYWTDPFKLQKQVDFMERNPNYVICYHNAERISTRYDVSSIIIGPQESDFDQTDIQLFNSQHIQTASIVFRNVSYSFPEHYKQYFGGDEGLIMSLAKYGKIRYMKDVMSIYRKHEGGITNNQSIEHYDHLIKTYNFQDHDFNNRYKEYNNKRRATIYRSKARYFYNKSFFRGIWAVICSIYQNPSFIKSNDTYSIIYRLLLSNLFNAKFIY
jgi:glycosyltransferase involved in cell wall biosynthesis